MRVAFLYSHDYTSEYERFNRGEVPAHWLFGAAHFAEFGHEAIFFAWPTWLPDRLRHKFVWRTWQAFMAVISQRRLAAIVCTTETPAQTLLLLSRIGLVRRPVAVMTVALLSIANSTGIRRRLWSWLLAKADVVYCYASSQVADLRTAFGLEGSQLTFLPFGVDTDFFAVAPSRGGTPHVLCVGTNAGKDMPTLVRALPDGRTCTIVSDPLNIDLARETVGAASVDFRQNVPISELRELYQDAVHIVIPLKTTTVSSGQTVLLENLVSGRVVIVSDVTSVADYIRGTACLTIPAGNVARLHELLMAPVSYQAAADEVLYARTEFNSRRLTVTVIADLESVISRYGLSKACAVTLETGDADAGASGLPRWTGPGAQRS